MLGETARFQQNIKEHCYGLKQNHSEIKIHSKTPSLTSAASTPKAMTSMYSEER